MIDHASFTPGVPTGEGVLLAASGVSKRFGATQALDEVSLQVLHGESVVLCGENGSGKSTLVRVLAGLVRPDAGDMSCDGRPLTFGDPPRSLGAGIALVTQEPTAVPAMSVAENLLLPLLRRPFRLVSPRRLTERAKPLLQRVGVDVDPRRPYSVLSTTQRELVEIARALATSPRLLILDEATTRLDDRNGVFELLEGLRADGLAMLTITHRMRDMLRFADRVVVLRDGRNAGSLQGSDIDEDNVTRLMVGRSIAMVVSQTWHDPGREPVLRATAVRLRKSSAAFDVHVGAGEIVGVAGLAGAGRTALLESIYGLRPRDAEVTVRGARVDQRSVRAALRSGMAFLPQDRRSQGLVLGLSVHRNVQLPRERILSFRPPRAGIGDAERMIRQMRIRTPSAGTRVSALSGGNQQKVALARCLVLTPGVLLLDEPTRGVDVGAKQEIYALIREQAAQGVAVLVASSDLPELLGLCHRILVMRDGGVAGEIAGDGGTEEDIARLWTRDAA